MNAYLASVIENVRKKNVNEPEFVQTVEEVFSSLDPVIDKHPEYEKADLLNRMSRDELERESLGSVMTKAVADVDACVEGMRKFTTEVFDTGVVLAAYIAMLLYYDWRLALLSGVFTPFAYLIAGRLKSRVARYSSAYKKSAGRLNGATMSWLSQPDSTVQPENFPVHRVAFNSNNAVGGVQIIPNAAGIEEQRSIPQVAEGLVGMAKQKQVQMLFPSGLTGAEQCMLDVIGMSVTE